MMPHSLLPHMQAYAFTLGGETFVSVDTAALWWPRAAALIVADMHLEKGSWFAERGQMLPPYDSSVTVRRLSALAEQWQVRAIFCLGDNFHDDMGMGRLPLDVVEELAALSTRVHMHWIVGNHDSAMAAPPGGTVHQQLDLHGISLRHIAQADSTEPEISGHYHPKFRMRLMDRTVSRPCYALDQRKLILPAFGAYTGGLDVQDPVILSLFPNGLYAMVHINDRLCQFPLSVTEPL